MLERLIHLPAGPAATATIIIRSHALWFGVTLGAAALAIFSRHFAAEREPAAETGAGGSIAR